MVLTDKDLKERLDKDIVIHPLEDSLIQGNGIDLRIGTIRPLSKVSEFRIEGGKIYIPPQSYCIIITQEFVWLSGNLIGTLHARGTLAAKGLYLNPTNVDPNFQGQMIMSVFNVSDMPVVLNEGETFITLILHQVKTFTNRLVGEEGKKQSMRVISSLREEIYTDKEKHKPQLESIQEVQNYYTDSFQSENVVFGDKIRAAKNNLDKEHSKYEL